MVIESTIASFCLSNLIMVSAGRDSRIIVISSTAFAFRKKSVALVPAPPLGSSALDALGFFSTVRSISEETTHARGTVPFTKQQSTGKLFEEDSSMDYIIENNHKWREEILARDPDAFKRLATSQSPKFLYIGCSDSRVPAQNIMGLHTGDLFVVRNVANLCVNTDHSLLAALVYAVNVLEASVTDIVVCGHYGCGGVKAAMENKDHGLLEHWLLNIRNVQRLHLEELEELEDMEERHRRFVELNVQESCINLFTNPVVQRKQAKDSIPKIHGLVYDMATGFLNKLDINFKTEIFKYEGVYRMYGFPESSKGKKKNKMTPKACKEEVKLAAPALKTL
ncbi:unnamed protein product [Ascophyllum nodosum]